jgi:hypothetical protein
LKRKIAFLLAMIMVFVAMLPVQVFAEKDKTLEGIVTKVKQVINIPSNFTFSPEQYTENGKKVWNLNWSNKGGEEGNINVRVNEKGTILGYDYWMAYDYSSRKLPKYSRQDAKTKAEAFLKKVNPDVLSNIRLMENNNDVLMDYTYYFSYVRLVNGVPFYNNTVNVGVNKQTGEVQNYSCNWNDDYVFPGKDKAISLDAAKKAYAEKIGLKLIYKYNYDNDKISLYAVYTPKYGSQYAINALTGEKIKLDTGFEGGYGGGGMMAKDQASFTVENSALTKEEVKSIEDLSNLISQEDAEKIARELKTFNLTSDYKLVNANLTRNWPLRNEYIWNLNFNKEAGKSEGSDNGYLSVSINAKTREITNFYRNTIISESSKAKYTEAQSKQAAEEFVKSFWADKFKNTEYDENVVTYYPYRSSTEEQKAYTFNYVRKINGVYFPDNTISVSFDAVNGEITNFNMGWFEVEFPAVKDAMDINKISDKLFSGIGLELQYKANYPQEYYYKGIMPEGGKVDVKLVYALKPGKPQFLDAKSGIVLNYDGKPYKENKPVVYTDIKGHSSEKQINVLSEYGISLEGSRFRPNDNITQLDFFTLLAKTLTGYYGPVINTNSTKEDINNLYKTLIREGIVKEAEKNPAGTVTNEEAVKFIIRAMKYDKVADIKGIFNCSFKDSKKISPNLIGYVAIAQGLKIASGKNGYFNPKTKITRAETAVMLYNYLQG